MYLVKRLPKSRRLPEVTIFLDPILVDSMVLSDEDEGDDSDEDESSTEEDSEIEGNSDAVEATEDDGERRTTH